MITVVKRAWLPVLLVAALAIGFVSISYLRSVFGSNGAVVTPVGSDTAEDFNPPRSSLTRCSAPAASRLSTTPTSTGCRNGRGGR